MPVFEKLPASEENVVEAYNYITGYESEFAIATIGMSGDIKGNIIKKNITHMNFCNDADLYDWHLNNITETHPYVFDKKTGNTYKAEYNKEKGYWELEGNAELPDDVSKTIENLSNDKHDDFVYFILPKTDWGTNLIYKSTAYDGEQYKITTIVGGKIVDEKIKEDMKITATWDDEAGLTVNIQMDKDTENFLSRFGITEEILTARLKKKLEHYITKEDGNYPIDVKIENHLSGYEILKMMDIGKRMTADTNDLYYKKVVIGTTHVEMETDGNLADENEALKTGWFDMLMAREQVIRVWDEKTDFSFELIMDVSGEITIDASKPYFAQTIENIFLTQLLDRYYSSLTPEQFAIVASKFMEAYKNGNAEYFGIKQIKEIEELQNTPEKKDNKNETQTRGRGLK